MKCEKIQTLLGAYVDGEIRTSGTVTLIEAHLESCTSCREVLNSQKEIKKILADTQILYETFLSPSILKARVMGEVRARKSKKQRIVSRPAFVIVGLVALLAIGITSVGFFANLQLEKKRTQAFLKALPERAEEMDNPLMPQGDYLIPTSSGNGDSTFLDFVQRHHQMTRELLILESDWAKTLENLQEFVANSENDSKAPLFKELPEKSKDKTKEETNKDKRR